MIYFVIFLFTITTFSHAIALVWAGQNQKLYISKRKRAWLVHFIVNGLLWLSLIVSIVIAEISFVERPHDFLFFLGAFITMFGKFFTGFIYLKLGTNTIMGRQFFLRENKKQWITSSIYKYLKNPMYDGFILIFLGLALMRGTTENLLLALSSFLLLNIFLSRIESKGHDWGIF